MKRPLTVQQLLVWVYRDQRTIEISGHGMYAGETAKGERWFEFERHVSGDGCVVIERLAVLGCAIDGGGPIRGIPQPLHPDAEMVHEIVSSMSWHKSGLLVTYARHGSQPEIPEPIRLVAVPVWNGRRTKHKTMAARDWELRCTRRWCPLVLSADPRDVERDMDRYNRWLDALDELEDRLKDVPLKAHEILPRTRWLCTGEDWPCVDG